MLRQLNLKSKPYMMYLFFTIQTIVFVYTQIAGYFQFGSGENGNILWQVGAMYPPLVQVDFIHNWYRFITPIFVHIGLMHYALNSITLFIFGEQLERIYGHTRFFLIYLLSGLLGNIVSFFWNTNTLCAGASTSLFGIFGAFVILKRYFPYNARVSQLSQSMIVLVGLNLAFGLFDPSIDLSGHIGGFIGGVLLGMICGIPNQEKNYPILERVLAAVAFVLFSSLLIVYKLNS